MLRIKGLQKMSLIDYPPYSAMTIFLPNCNMRCAYCHNPELVLCPETLATISEEEVITYLKEKKQWIDAVCITGGEPTLHGKELIEFMKKVKELNFRIKLDTNGTNPTLLTEIINEKLVDYIAMDIKGPLNKYGYIANASVNVENIKKSVDLIKNSGVDYEFRTTMPPDLLGKDDLIKIAKWLKGSHAYYLQRFRNGKTLDPEFKDRPTYSEEELESFKDTLKPYFTTVDVRV